MAVTFDSTLRSVRRMVAMTLDDSVAVSYPLPDLHNGRKTDRVFLYRRGNRSPEGPRPFALMTLDHATGQLLGYADARLEDFMGQEHQPWNRRISYALAGGITVQDVQEEQTMLRKLYEGVRCFAFQDSLTEPEKEVLRKFVFLMHNAGPDSLQPYYAAMGQNFYRWVNEHV